MGHTYHVTTGMRRRGSITTVQVSNVPRIIRVSECRSERALVSGVHDAITTYDAVATIERLHVLAIPTRKYRWLHVAYGTVAAVDHRRDRWRHVSRV